MSLANFALLAVINFYDADRAALRRADSFFFNSKQPAAALAELEAVLRPGRPSFHADMARLQLANVYKALGRDEERLHLLLALSCAPADDDGRANFVVGEALPQLGDYYRQRGDFTTAREYYTAWEPYRWCGTCQQQVDAYRARALRLCAEGLGEVEPDMFATPATAVRHFGVPAVLTLGVVVASLAVWRAIRARRR